MVHEGSGAGGGNSRACLESSFVGQHSNHVGLELGQRAL